MARRAWEHGWPRYHWARPIRDVLDEEASLARQRAAEIQRRALERESTEAEALRQAQAAAQAEERQMLTVARRDVLGALVIAAELTPQLRALAQLTAQRLDGGAVPPGEALTLIGRHAAILGKAVSATESLIKLGRLDREQATERVALLATDELSWEDACEELEAAGELLDLVRESAEAPIDAAGVPLPEPAAEGGE